MHSSRRRPTMSQDNRSSKQRMGYEDEKMWPLLLEDDLALLIDEGSKAFMFIACYSQQSRTSVAAQRRVGFELHYTNCLSSSTEDVDSSSREWGWGKCVVGKDRESGRGHFGPIQPRRQSSLSLFLSLFIRAPLPSNPNKSISGSITPIYPASCKTPAIVVYSAPYHQV